MKKLILNLTLLVTTSFLLTSCYTYTYVVGKGPQTGQEVVSKNHYLIAGLAPIKIADPNAMAGGAKDYQVTVTHSFIDGLIASLTGSIYTPTTVKVKK